MGQDGASPEHVRNGSRGHSHRSPAQPRMLRIEFKGQPYDWFNLDEMGEVVCTDEFANTLRENIAHYFGVPFQCQAVYDDVSLLTSTSDFMRALQSIRPVLHVYDVRTMQHDHKEHTKKQLEATNVEVQRSQKNLRAYMEDTNKMRHTGGAETNGQPASPQTQSPFSSQHQTSPDAVLPHNSGYAQQLGPGSFSSGHVHGAQQGGSHYSPVDVGLQRGGSAASGAYPAWEGHGARPVEARLPTAPFASQPQQYASPLGGSPPAQQLYSNGATHRSMTPTGARDRSSSVVRLSSGPVVAPPSGTVGAYMAPGQGRATPPWPGGRPFGPHLGGAPPMRPQMVMPSQTALQWPAPGVASAPPVGIPWQGGAMVPAGSGIQQFHAWPRGAVLTGMPLTGAPTAGNFAPPSKWAPLMPPGQGGFSMGGACTPPPPFPAGGGMITPPGQGGFSISGGGAYTPPPPLPPGEAGFCICGGGACPLPPPLASGGAMFPGGQRMSQAVLFGGGTTATAPSGSTTPPSSGPFEIR